MDIILTFEDGSEEHISHYGVRGMKWGKWNPETQARYAGAGNGTYYRKAKRGSEYSRSVTDLRRAYNANQPKSKQIAKNLLLGPGGAHAYNTSRSRGLGRSESLLNSMAGVWYAQGVKAKQNKQQTTTPMISKAAKRRSEYENKESLPKTTLKTALLGVGGSTAYNAVRSRSKGRGRAAVSGVLTSAAVQVTGLPHTGYLAYTVDRRGTGKQQVKANSFNTRKPGQSVNVNPSKYTNWDPNKTKQANIEAYKAAHPKK